MRPDMAHSLDTTQPSSVFMYMLMKAMVTDLPGTGMRGSIRPSVKASIQSVVISDLLSLMDVIVASPMIGFVHIDCLSIWSPRLGVGSFVHAAKGTVSVVRVKNCSGSSSGLGKLMLQKFIVSEW